jgi:hypothetical protein
MPRHLKKTAVKPTSGMPQTRQLAASGGVLISKGALMQRIPFRFAAVCTLRLISETGDRSGSADWFVS